MNTGWTIPDEFASRFVFFYSGYVFAPQIFKLAAAAIARPWTAGAYLLAWAGLEIYAVFWGYSEMIGVSLVLGIVGAVAVVTFSSLLSKSDLMAPVRYCGRNSIVIYLAFFLPMATARTILLKYGPITDLGTISVIVTACGVIGPLVLFWIVRDTPFRFLFHRPAWARAQPATGRLVPAE